jgi:eukaryotic-like serine/threonine-protein kinase
MVDRIGQQLGNYRLQRFLGEGGFAEVYVGEHIHLGTEAAIKVHHSQLTNEDVEQFRNEARTIARLKHRHIVRVFDFGVEGKTPFLVMDYAPHGNLRQRHPRGSVLPISSIVFYVKQIAAALQYAHDQKLIHRDIKPENILLETEHEILLSDFGIALVAQSSRYQTPSTKTPSLGTTLTIYHGRTTNIESVAWSPDGKRLVTGSHDQTCFYLSPCCPQNCICFTVVA